jgi:16S rRNA (guanine527-N7)-methyltransferase
MTSKAIADVGSGAGFPGIPLSILEPASSVVLMESVGKKCAFLKHAVRTLGLCNVEVYNGRAEAYPAPETFDLAVSRALGSLANFYDIAHKLLRLDGRIVCMKGRLPLDEIEALKKGRKDIAALESYSYCLPEQGQERCLVMVSPCFT